MEDAGVFAGSDDRRVGELAAAADEFVGKFGFDFVFENAWANEAGHAFEASLRDAAGFFNEADFVRRFDDAKPMHQSPQAMISMQRITPFHIGNEAGFASGNFHNGAWMFV